MHAFHTQIHAVASLHKHARIFFPASSVSNSGVQSSGKFKAAKKGCSFLKLCHNLDESFECAPLIFCLFLNCFAPSYSLWLWPLLVPSCTLASGICSACRGTVCAVCILTPSSMMSLLVYLCLCPVWSLSLSVLFTGKTQTSHPFARPPPRRLPPKGTDNAVLA